VNPCRDAEMKNEAGKKTEAAVAPSSPENVEMAEDSVQPSPAKKPKTSENLIIIIKKKNK
jgi:hypothetical protein